MTHKKPCNGIDSCLYGDNKELEPLKEKCPLVWLIILAVMVAVGCGGLLAWRQTNLQTQPEVVMMLQHYDDFGNIVEIPQIDIPNGYQNQDTLKAVNDQMEQIHDKYQAVIESFDDDRTGFRVICYPTVGGQYLSILLQEEVKTDTSSGMDIPVLISWVYDKSGKIMLEDSNALELAGVTMEDLLVQLNQHIDRDPMDPWNVNGVTLQAFYIDRSEEITLFLIARTSGLGDAVYNRLYAWKEGNFSRIDIFDEDRALFYTEDTTQMDSPLWNEWYFDSEA